MQISGFDRRISGANTAIGMPRSFLIKKNSRARQHRKLDGALRAERGALPALLTDPEGLRWPSCRRLDLLTSIGDFRTTRELTGSDEYGSPIIVPENVVGVSDTCEDDDDEIDVGRDDVIDPQLGDVMSDDSVEVLRHDPEAESVNRKYFASLYIVEVYH